MSSWLSRLLIFISAPPSKIQFSAKDFEDEKLDRQSMQHQLHKVLKELRKARDQIAKLESAVSVTGNLRFFNLSLFDSLILFWRVVFSVSETAQRPVLRAQLLQQVWVWASHHRWLSV